MSEWGPLQALAGIWEGNVGLDVSFHNDEDAVAETHYFERAEFKPFGPVDNGKQHLYGLDYRMAAWRHGEEDQNPFHTEVGYWLWDAEANEVMRCFMVPRGTVVIGGAHCEADATAFTLRAELGSTTYGVLENLYLAQHASTTEYICEIDLSGGTYTYRSDSVLKMAAMGGEILHHTDANTLKKVSEA